MPTAELMLLVLAAVRMRFSPQLKLAEAKSPSPEALFMLRARAMVPV